MIETCASPHTDVRAFAFEDAHEACRKKRHTHTRARTHAPLHTIIPFLWVIEDRRVATTQKADFRQSVPKLQARNITCKWAQSDWE